jgi:hypothetical protein
LFFFLTQESTILTRANNVTTKSGGTHRCDGTNLNSNPTPGPTATGALADAAKRVGFFWDAKFYPEFDDFYITRIGKTEESTKDKESWRILVNYEPITVGGCQKRVQLNDEVLFAFDAFYKKFFLKLTGPLTARRGQASIFTVTDGSTGLPIAGAKVGRQVSDERGNVQIAFTSGGRKELKATRSDSVRSNVLVVRVN